MLLLEPDLLELYPVVLRLKPELLELYPVALRMEVLLLVRLLVPAVVLLVFAACCARLGFFSPLLFFFACLRLLVFVEACSLLLEL